ncbi:MAG: ester cyclase [Chloroflexota bacterium]|nr:ester cyclase [Chloroflexota bacterium]MDE2940911.1 ester cyclase [Chloroflexota bacterium]MDE3268388.1 ester cyclase [Chloroflexota bacterium]
MSTEENKATYRRFFEGVMNRKDMTLLDELLAEDVASHAEPPPGFPDGAEGYKLMVGVLHGAFPDMHVEIDSLVAEGDLVVGHHTTTGTHTGELMGMPATGRSVKVEGLHMVRFTGGRISEYCFQTDMMGLMQQLGALPSS